MTEAFVYCWTDHRTNKLYVGSHKGSLDDGYICSSKIMLEEYKKRPDDFSRQIIAEGCLKDIRKLEAEILKSSNAALNEQFYNMNNGDGKFFCAGHTKETRQKMSKSHKNKTILPETREKMKISNVGKKRNEITKQRMRDNNTKPWLGKKHTKETKQKMSESMTGKKHKKYYGRPVSEETKQKMRESMKKSEWHMKKTKEAIN
jgi:hypothetical protein